MTTCEHFSGEHSSLYREYVQYGWTRYSYIVPERDFRPDVWKNSEDRTKLRQQMTAHDFDKLRGYSMLLANNYKVRTEGKVFTDAGRVSGPAWSGRFGPTNTVGNGGSYAAGKEPASWRKSRVAEKPSLPSNSDQRKGLPVYSGVCDYFPKALAYVARVSKESNDKHNPGQPLHWSKEKSADHLDCIGRHLLDAGKIDPASKLRESGFLAWRALANLQIELEAAEARGEKW